MEKTLDFEANQEIEESEIGERLDLISSKNEAKIFYVIGNQSNPYFFKILIENRNS